jgi:muconolactone delta-isomerase
MSTPRTRNSRVFTISFPADLARQVEETARKESRNLSELFREAFRTYQLEKIHKRLDQIRAKLPPTSYKEDDVPELVREMRRESQESQVA